MNMYMKLMQELIASGKGFSFIDPKADSNCSFFGITEKEIAAKELAEELTTELNNSPASFSPKKVKI